jgi:CHASE3 domain sensor protein
MFKIFTNPATWEIISKFGAPLVIAIVFSFVILFFSIWLVKSLLKSYERERSEHQKFLSDAVRANTEQLRMVGERFNDITNMQYRMIDSFIAYTKNVEESVSRLETADRFQREEHLKTMTLLNEAITKLAVIQDEIKYINRT